MPEIRRKKKEEEEEKRDRFQREKEILSKRTNYFILWIFHKNLEKGVGSTDFKSSNVVGHDRYYSFPSIPYYYFPRNERCKTNNRQLDEFVVIISINRRIYPFLLEIKLVQRKEYPHTLFLFVKYFWQNLIPLQNSRRWSIVKRNRERESRKKGNTSFGITRFPFEP